MKRALVKNLGTSSIFGIDDHFEVQFNISLKGVIQEPTDEDFGVWAWCYRSYDRALRKAQTIESGVCKIVPMNHQL